MAKYVTFALALVSIAGSSLSATFQVTTTADAGAGSLRWAIQQANASAAADTITFASSLSGETIMPLTSLPAITAAGDTINGDLDADGDPDIALSGEKQTYGNGLRIVKIAIRSSSLGESAFPLPDAPRFIIIPVGVRITGLSIVKFPRRGIYIGGRNSVTIRSCHIGVDLSGNVALPNGDEGLGMVNSNGNEIGGTLATQGNVFSVGDATTYAGHAIIASGSSNNRIRGNLFGLRRDGAGAFLVGNNCRGIFLSDGSGNQIGGSTAGERNYFGGFSYAVMLYDQSNATVSGNVFGLLQDGDTYAPIPGDCVHVDSGSHDCVIGGGTFSRRNVFAGGTGVRFIGAGVENNIVRRNLFGSNVSGGKRRELHIGVLIDDECGSQTIGGKGKGGNYFTPYVHGHGVITYATGGNAVVQGNYFGVGYKGGEWSSAEGIQVSGANALVEKNLFAKTAVGIEVRGTGGIARAFANRFRGCERAVWIQADGNARLGNLGNGNGDDDGGNDFKPTNTWHVWNDSPNLIKAEGNNFHTTARAKIEAKIRDKLDNPAAGRVDHIPLSGGVLPTGEAAMATVTSAVATPTATGAEIAFTLSAPAIVTVEVLNIAGRPVAVAAQDRATEAGLQRLVWSGQTLGGTKAPGGRYLIRVRARTAEGDQSTALAPVLLW